MHPITSTDPCSGTACGKGAECRLVSSLVVCVCDENSIGDPFVECKPIPTPAPGMHFITKRLLFQFN